MSTAPSELPADLFDLRAMSAALANAEMDPISQARESIRIANAAVSVAFTQGVITTETAQGLINGLDALLNTLEDTEGVG